MRFHLADAREDKEREARSSVARFDYQKPERKILPLRKETAGPGKNKGLRFLRAKRGRERFAKRRRIRDCTTSRFQKLETGLAKSEELMTCFCCWCNRPRMLSRAEKRNKRTSQQ